MYADDVTHGYSLPYMHVRWGECRNGVTLLSVGDTIPVFVGRG